MANIKKPRLVFFQFRYDETLPPFLLTHIRDHVDCLSRFFDVTVIRKDCDYAEVCDTFEPDLALFESGVNHLTCRRLKITNTRSHPAVPKLALHNADAFCIARAGFLSDLDHWGIEAAFAITTTGAEHTPEIADRLFVWPNCINPEIYRDYDERKNIPVLFTGNTNALYPWRRKIQKLVSERYPSLICQHSGYVPGGSNKHILHGEAYARLINASLMAPACGTVANEVVRKHFEIPACNACLITERSAALEAAGFVDMENCVFADERNVLDKVEHLFRNRDDLQRITEHGYQLVHRHHTLNERDQIFQWYSLRKQQQSHQRIVQTNPFGGLQLVDRATGIQSAHVSGEGRHLVLLGQGYERLRAGKYDEAEAAFLKCLNYIGWMPEPKLGVALCRLHKGDPKTAASLLSEQIEFTIASYGAVDPDPVEWAYYLVALLCQGKAEAAAGFASDFGWLDHPVLERARWAVGVLQDKAVAPLTGRGRRPTIHRFPDQDCGEWLIQVCRMLQVCGRRDFADKLKHAGDRLASWQETRLASQELAIQKDGSPTANHFAARFIARERAVIDIFRRRYGRRLSRSALRSRIARAVHSLEMRFGYFLPYRLSEKKRDEFFSEVEKLASQENIRTAILIGAPRALDSVDALLAGMSEGDARPRVFCIDRFSPRFRRLERRFSGRVVCCGVDAASPADFHRGLQQSLSTIYEKELAGRLDIVLVDGTVSSVPGLSYQGPQMDLKRARLVVLDGTNNLASYENLTQLLKDNSYEIVAHNPGWRGGYTILKKTADNAARTVITNSVGSEQRLPAEC